ncbi:MAG: hypothetical protein ACTHXA_14110 [Gulosibacter sp.]|uniref:hypothetical protein n=1 Tax=Gulosibacter sp. TaxID=2817531 RepID=UPI003F8DFDC5
MPTDPEATEPHANEPNESEVASASKREDLTVVEVRPGVNITGWIWGGAALGLVLSAVFAYALPQNSEFTRGQVFGFLAVFLTALTAVLVTGIGLIVDFIVGRTGTPTRVVLQRVPSEDEVAADVADAADAGTADVADAGAADQSGSDVASGADKAAGSGTSTGNKPAPNPSAVPDTEVDPKG